MQQQVSPPNHTKKILFFNCYFFSFIAHIAYGINTVISIGGEGRCFGLTAVDFETIVGSMYAPGSRGERSRIKAILIDYTVHVCHVRAKMASCTHGNNFIKG